jgi:hypothetical protein
MSMTIDFSPWISVQQTYLMLTALIGGVLAISTTGKDRAA